MGTSSQRHSWTPLLVLVTLALLVGSCSLTDSSATDTGAPASTTTAPGDPAPAPSASTTVAAPTAPGAAAAMLGGINGSALEYQYGKGVVLVLTRDCNRGVGTGSGFAIDKRTIVTNWHVVADDSHDAASTIDPRPWILTYNRGWRRGSVLGASASPDIAVIQLDADEPDMAATLKWADKEVQKGDFLAIMGYPGLEHNEFQLTVAQVVNPDATARTADDSPAIPSFRLDKVLSARTGPGNSGGPIVNAAGEVVGVHTWGLSDRRAWFGSDGPVARSAAEEMKGSPSRMKVACEADSEKRFALTYVVKLGTFGDVESYNERLAAIADAGPAGAQIIAANTAADSDFWDGFLLSDYPYVMLAGPFDKKEQAESAKDAYQRALEAAGQKDRFTVGVVPKMSFKSDDTVDTRQKQCAQFTGKTVLVTGVSTTDPLKLREGPTTKAAVIDDLDNGTVLQVTTDDEVEADGNTWIRVAPAKDNGTICGWVAKRYTTS